MIFEDISKIEKIAIEQRIQHRGTYKKAPSSRSRFHSNMMLNPLNLKHLNSIDSHSAHMITLNLEDAIAPSRKKEALYNIALFLSHLQKSESFIIVRTNPIDEGGAKEIEFLNDFSFDALRIPKVKYPKDVAKALSLLSTDKELHISLETAQAFQTLPQLAIDERLTTANLGILDLLTSLGLSQGTLQMNNPTIEYILSKFLVDAKSCGIRPISFMFQQYRDTKTFREWCIKEEMMGYETKACMGPAQVAIAHEVFGVDSVTLQRAKDIKKLFEASASRGVNGFLDERYGFIDEPIYRDALLTLQGDRQ